MTIAAVLLSAPEIETSLANERPAVPNDLPKFNIYFRVGVLS